MADQETAPVLEQDRPTQENAEESTDARPQAGEVDPQATQEQGDDKPEHKRLGGWQRKIAKQEQEIEFWREEALRNRQKPAEQDTKPAKEDAKPDINSYNTHEEYVEALTEYKAKKIFHDMRAEEDRQAQAAETKAAEEKTASTWQERVAEASKTHADFEEVVSNPSIPLTPAMAHVILNSELGPDIAYYLGKNPEEARRITAMAATDPMGLMMAKEVGKIEDRLAREQSANGKEPEAPARANPKPPTPVGRSGATDSGLRDDLTLKEWNRRREAQLKAR